MAKGNLFQGLARGSIGDVVFYRINGQQVTRVRNRQIKNPKTGSQMAQRCVMSNVSKAYSALKYICDHSFEGISYGARNMSNFMRLNAAIVRQCAISELENVSWVCRGHNVAPVLPLQVSSGSMPTMSAKWSISNRTEEGVANTNYGILVDAVNRGVNQCSAKLFLEQMGGKAGDIFTLVCLCATSPNHLGDEDFKSLNTQLKYCRIKIKDVLPLNLSELDWWDGQILDYTDSNLNDPEGEISVGNDFNIIEGAYGTSGNYRTWIAMHTDNNVNNFVLSAALIHSRKQGGAYLRSSEIMKTAEGGYPQALLPLTDWNTALQSYMVSGSELGDNPYYLNGGDL